MDYKREIEELHDVFEAYFSGLENSLARVESALGSPFAIVGPSGEETDRRTTLERLAAGHGHAQGLTISTADHRLLHRTDEVLVAAYTEQHDWADGRSSQRLSTVIFTIDADAPNGLRWLRVHETWLSTA